MTNKKYIYEVWVTGCAHTLYKRLEEAYEDISKLMPCEVSIKAIEV